jgi:ABC-type Na+ efflux pump permease subunit
LEPIGPRVQPMARNAKRMGAAYAILGAIILAIAIGCFLLLAAFVAEDMTVLNLLVLALVALLGALAIVNGVHIWRVGRPNATVRSLTMLVGLAFLGTMIAINRQALGK